MVSPEQKGHGLGSVWASPVWKGDQLTQKKVCTQVKVSKCFPRPALLLEEKCCGTATQISQQDAAAEGIQKCHILQMGAQQLQP